MERGKGGWGSRRKMKRRWGYYLIGDRREAFFFFDQLVCNFGWQVKLVVKVSPSLVESFQVV